MSNTYLKKIALVGGSGNIGASTIKHLLEINKTIAITVITRQESTAAFPDSPQITVKKGSYDDPAFLHAAFAGHDLAMFALAFQATEGQSVLIDAAAKAGVQWIVPNEYAGDGTNEQMATGVPLFQPKTVTRKQILDLGLKYIAVATNPWTEPSITRGLFGIDVPNRSATLFSDSGKFDTTSMDQAGLGIARLLSLPITSSSDPRASLQHYANNYVYLSSFSITQQDLFTSIKKATSTSDADWKVETVSIQDRIRNLRKKFEEGDFWAGAGLTYCYYMGEGLGGDYDLKAKEDRKVLQLEGEDLDAVVKRAVAASG